MFNRIAVGALTVAILSIGASSAWSWDETAYPDLRGQWSRISPPGTPAFDPNKPRGYGQEVPYTEEYKARFESILADLRAGGEGSWPGYRCRPPGMPPMMTAYEPAELHDDNKTVVRERIYIDKADANLLHDEITVIDSALMQPWTVKKSYPRGQNLPNVAKESVCADNNTGVVTIGNEEYTLGQDGNLMPIRRGQPAPDLRYFK